jgi:SAM-dependent methyltransferase
MSPHPRTRPFALSAGEIDAIGNAFRKAGFDEAGVISALGVKGIPALKDLPAEAAYRRTSAESPLNTLIRLFVIGAPALPEAIRKAFDGLPPERLAAGGLMSEASGKFYAAVKMTPIGGLWIAFDRSWEGESAEPPDHVMGPSDSASLLAGLVIRRGFENVLDVGAGCGYLAFLAAKNNNRVVATDLNPRAAAFVELNARLNGIRNVEARVGDLFAPVAGETFDLVISNPPFVISPEDRLVYLNGGMKADAFCQRMAAEAPAFLREGGYFQMLCNWVENADIDWQERLRGWFREGGCDTWVLRSSSTDPVTYAQTWMKAGHYRATEDHDARLEAWLEYYREEKVAAIGAGVVIMRKRPGDSNWFRSFDGPARIAGQCGEVVLERMQALDYMARRAGDDAALMASIFRVSEKARLTQECRPSAEGWALTTASIRVTEGFAYVEEIDTWFAELLVACDGKRTLEAAVAKTAAALGLNADEVPAETAEIARQLVDEGFLVPVGL